MFLCFSCSYFGFWNPYWQHQSKLVISPLFQKENLNLWRARRKTLSSYVPTLFVMYFWKSPKSRWTCNFGPSKIEHTLLIIEKGTPVLLTIQREGTLEGTRYCKKKKKKMFINFLLSKQLMKIFEQESFLLCTTKKSKNGFVLFTKIKRKFVHFFWDQLGKVNCNSITKTITLMNHVLFELYSKVE